MTEQTDDASRLSPSDEALVQSSRFTDAKMRNEPQAYKLAVMRMTIAAIRAHDEAAGMVLVPKEPTEAMIKPLASAALKIVGIDPDEPCPPHGEYPRWYEIGGEMTTAYTAMLSAHTGEDG